MQFGKMGIDERGQLHVDLLNDDGTTAAHIIAAISSPPAEKRHIGFGAWSRLKAIAGKRP